MRAQGPRPDGIHARPQTRQQCITLEPQLKSDMHENMTMLHALKSSIKCFQIIQIAQR